MLRAFLSSFSVIIVGVICAFFTHLILAKTLAATEYGIFSFIYSVSLLLSVFSLFGFQNSVVRLIPNYQNEFDKIKGLIKFSNLFTIGISLVSAFICFLILKLFGFDTKYPLETLQLSFILTPLMVFMRLQAAFMRGFEKSLASVLYETSLREIIFLSLIGAFFIWGKGIETGFDALMLLAMSLCIVSVVSWFHTRRTIHQKIPSSQSQSFEVQHWMSLSLPMMFTIFTQRLLRRSDIIILGIMVHPALVGAYAIIAQFSDMSAIGQKGIFAVFSARAASLYKNKSEKELKNLYRKMQIYGTISAAILCLSIALLAPYLLEFFGKEYQVGYHALLILLVGQFVNVCLGPIGILMIMTAYEKTMMKLTFMAAIGNVILTPLAVYFYGLEGAAFSTAFLLILRSAIGYTLMKQQKVI